MEVTKVNKIFKTKEEAIEYARYELLTITSLKETDNGWQLEAWGPYGSRQERAFMLVAECLIAYRYI